MKGPSVLGFVMFISSVVFAQPDRWQQKIKYQIDADLNVQTNKMQGVEKLDYWNNSPDTLHRLFFHLYWNAFKPGSMMDVRSRHLGKTLLFTTKNGDEIYDWDSRVEDRISKLSPDEEGSQVVNSLKIAGKAQQLIEHETILEVVLSSPIMPHSKTSMEVSFEAQVPIQIRRSGRDNAEGIRYSMSQWYPKLVEYDYQGWNANPYVAREFYGVWGDFDVNITIDRNYMIAGTGTLLNNNEIGFGYETSKITPPAPSVKNLTWKFSAKNVHDFVWAADTAFTMIKKQVEKGPLLYIVYKKVDSLQQKWVNLAETVEKAYPFIEKNFGPYPYKNYSFIQGGDGGMEYPMATLIKSPSVGTALHEWMHSWYQGVLGTNESLYAWMDEGFTTYAESKVSAWLRNDSGFAFKGSYSGYYNLVKSGREEPMSTHADHYKTNYAYSQDAYSKGAVFLAQLGYIVGDSVLNNILHRYYAEWMFKHPNPNDFIRIAEKESGLILQWYKEYWVYTTKTIDYALGEINSQGDGTTIKIKNVSDMPMPVEVLITYKDGSMEMHYIPLNLTFGNKIAQGNVSRIIHKEWNWVNPEYDMNISHNVGEIKSIEIDPGFKMADINRANNKILVPEPQK